MISSCKKYIISCSLAVLGLAAGSTAAFAGEHYSVDLNKTEVVYLPENAGAIVVGNPEIADISIHSANTLFVVGRGYGETNLIVLNAQGHSILNADIQVTQTQPSHGVRLYNGKDRESYSCTPNCLPSPVLGDTPVFIGINSGTAQTISNNASTTSPTTFGGTSSSLPASSGLSGPFSPTAPSSFTPSSSSRGSGSSFSPSDNF